MSFSNDEHRAMAMTIHLAKQGKYCTQPNPMVGCVITDNNNKIITMGYHKIYGGNHAEIEALNQLKNLKISLNYAQLKMFVSLEPCCFNGKTLPCTQAIIDSGIKTVIIAMLDPNKKVLGRGISTLKQAGILVKTGLLENTAKALNPAFIKAMQTKLPFVTCKIGMSLDGKTAMKNGQSKWITNPYARKDVQKLRAQVDAILTGSGTVLADNPYLTVRHKHCARPPIRIVLDTRNRLTKEAHIFSNDAQTQHYTGQNTHTINHQIALIPLLKKLHQTGINHILLEAGSTLVGRMLSEQLIDELVIYTAPIIMGSDAISAINSPIKNLTDAVPLKISKIRMIGDNLKIIATPNYKSI